MTSAVQQTTTNSSQPAPPVMLAVAQDAYGSADVLRMVTVPRPTCGDDDVLVRVRAAGVHIGDWHLMTGRPYLMRVMGFGLRRPRARVRGTDVAGVVETVGRDVTRFRPGDEVFGTCHGAFAEHTVAREGGLALKPTGISFEQAAAVPTSGCTALQSLRAAGGVRSGQQVLVIGASGGVGLFAVQLAKAQGAEVTGVCSTTKQDLVLAAGADHVLDYTRQEVTAGGHRYDVVLDLGGTRTLTLLRRVLRPRGALVLIGGEQGGHWVGAATARSLRALVLSPFVGQRLRMVLGRATAADLRVLAGLIDAEEVAPVVDRTYPLAEAADALRHLTAGHSRGKVVLTV